MADEQTRDQAKTGMKETGTVAAEKSRETAAAASEEAKAVAGTAREQAGEVRQELSHQSQRVVQEAGATLQKQGREQTQQLAGTVRNWAEQAQALVDGRPQEAGQVADYARQATGKVTELADHIEARGFDGLIDDVQRFARRRPGVFLFGAAAAGFAVGRLVRGAAAAQQDEGQAQPDNRSGGSPQELSVSAMGSVPAVTAYRGEVV